MIVKNLKKSIKSRINLFDTLLLREDYIFKAIELIETSLRGGNKILIFGNGGSAMQASHFAAELVNKYYKNRDALPAIALTSDVANLTSIANDRGFRYIFSRQLQALGKKGDVAIGITTSGGSANIVDAFKTARKKELKTVALCGSHIIPFQNPAVDVIISVNSSDTPIIQEMHLFILHIVADSLEKKFWPNNIQKTRENG